MAQLTATLPTIPMRRPRWRAYLLLARVSNLPTVWSNVLAGSAAAGIAGSGPDLPLVLWLVAAASVFYTGGMLLNDAFDAPYDAAARPERPIPRQDVPRPEVFVAGALCLLAAELLLPPGLTRWLGAALATAIVVYDVSHKQNPMAPVVMGACRGLVYAVAGAAAAAPALSAMGLPPAVLTGAAIMWAYVLGLTIVARLAGPKARWLVPLLIAGISLVDAVFIAVVAPALWPVAVLAAAGFPLTLILQRWVPGD